MAQLEFAALYLRYEKKDFNVHLLAHNLLANFLL